MWRFTWWTKNLLFVFALLFLSCEEQHVANNTAPTRVAYDLKQYADGNEYNTYKNGKLKKKVFYNKKGIMIHGESYDKNSDLCNLVNFDSIGNPEGYWNYYKQIKHILYVRNARFNCDFEAFVVESYENRKKVIDTLRVYKKNGWSYINLDEVYAKRNKKFHFLRINYEVPVRNKVVYCVSDIVRVGESIEVDKYNLNGVW